MITLGFPNDAQDSWQLIPSWTPYPFSAQGNKHLNSDVVKERSPERLLSSCTSFPASYTEASGTQSELAGDEPSRARSSFAFFLGLE